ncbi:DUF1330 domain-containing protein [Amycolatopsis sp. OK19-0408]|uniref:DUF1330 domain-containing protein n=1 Tax=Amycolatopsis iheyensis TaxID=2945988 RepID=A0A9X2SRB7_9PSEU|nr:DUF1330 domain-containing protein [Amycolatopsis iheyensis]MCR6489820.1 DUF1330 domain-containing protein [Amycolatopsis iheyensis]
MQEHTDEGGIDVLGRRRRPGRGSPPPAPGRQRRQGYGRTFARGRSRVVADEAGIAERVVLIEFDSFEQAVAAYESAAYQEALAVLSDGFARDFRIVEGID